MKTKLNLTVAWLAAAIGPAVAADNYQVKDPLGISLTFAAKEVASIKYPMSIPTGPDGTPYGAANPQFFSIVGTSPLPTGAATAAAQATGNASLASLDTKHPALVNGRSPVDGSGVTQPISASALPLPAGAATATAQATGNASLASIDGKQATLVSGRVPIDGSAVTQPVSASALPLPTGAATVAAQTTGNTSLASLDTKSPALVGGRVPIDTVAVGTATDRGGTVATGGTAQTFAASNTSRRGFTFQNQSSGDLYFSCSATATLDYHSLRVPPGALQESAPHHIGTGACSVIGATTGQAFYAREF